MNNLSSDTDGSLVIIYAYIFPYVSTW